MKINILKKQSPNSFAQDKIIKGAINFQIVERNNYKQFQKYFSEIPIFDSKLAQIQMRKQKISSLQNSSQKHIAKQKSQFCYFINLKPIYKTPLNRYDFNSYNGNINNSENTQYFNYGFDSQTMTIYNKFMNKCVDRENNRKEPLSYDPSSWNLLKLNDSIPTDLGGFGPILDTKGIQFDLGRYFDEDLMMKELVYRCLQSTTQHQRFGCLKQNYGMIEFIHSMYLQCHYQQNNLAGFIGKLEKYFDEKYNDMICEEKGKIFGEANKIQKSQIQSNKEEQNIYDFIFKKISNANQQQEIYQHKEASSTNDIHQKYQHQHQNQHLIDCSSSNSESDQNKKQKKQKKGHRNRKSEKRSDSHSGDSDRQKERKHRHKHSSKNKKMKKHKHHHKANKKEEHKQKKHRR